MEGREGGREGELERNHLAVWIELFSFIILPRAQSDRAAGFACVRVFVCVCVNA